MHELYVVCQLWQLGDVRKLLSGDESLTTNSYCFRPDTYVIKHNREDGGKDEKVLVDALLGLGITIPLQ